jgi:hypothetical protein
MSCLSVDRRAHMHVSPRPNHADQRYEGLVDLVGLIAGYGLFARS